MPRYFFNIFDGDPIVDDEGTELPDFYTAQTEAVRLSGEVLSSVSGKFWNHPSWRLEVSDAAGKVLFILHFSAEDRTTLSSTDRPKAQ